MRTTLNLPDALVAEAKIQAVRNKSTLTDLLVEGLRLRLQQTKPLRSLPVSLAGGGLVDGVDWQDLQSADSDEAFR